MTLEDEDLDPDGRCRCGDVSDGHECPACGEVLCVVCAAVYAGLCAACAAEVREP